MLKSSAGVRDPGIILRFKGIQVFLLGLCLEKAREEVSCDNFGDRIGIRFFIDNVLRSFDALWRRGHKLSVCRAAHKGVGFRRVHGDIVAA